MAGAARALARRCRGRRRRGCGGDGDSQLPWSIPSTRRERRSWRSWWWSSLGSGWLQSPAIRRRTRATTRPWQKEERARERERGRGVSEWRAVRRRGSLIVLTSRQESERGGSGRRRTGGRHRGVDHGLLQRRQHFCRTPPGRTFPLTTRSFPDFLLFLLKPVGF